MLATQHGEIEPPPPELLAATQQGAYDLSPSGSESLHFDAFVSPPAAAPSQQQAAAPAGRLFDILVPDGKKAATGVILHAVAPNEMTQESYDAYMLAAARIPKLFRQQSAPAATGHVMVMATGTYSYTATREAYTKYAVENGIMDNIAMYNTIGGMNEASFRNASNSNTRPSVSSFPDSYSDCVSLVDGKEVMWLEASWWGPDFITNVINDGGSYDSVLAEKKTALESVEAFAWKTMVAKLVEYKGLVSNKPVPLPDSVWRALAKGNIVEHHLKLRPSSASGIIESYDTLSQYTISTQGRYPSAAECVYLQRFRASEQFDSDRDVVSWGMDIGENAHVVCHRCLHVGNVVGTSFQKW